MIDMIAIDKDQNDDLILHWGIGRNRDFEWVAPDNKFLPPDTK